MPTAISPPASAVERSTIPCQLPVLPGIHLAARYREPRIGGDFFDIAATAAHLFLMMTDIAGEREDTQRIAAEVQLEFHMHDSLQANRDHLNESHAAVELLRAINGAIITASRGVRCAPTFVGVYNLAAHTLTYINAGAAAALLASGNDVRTLDSTGIPLGLFTHLTHEPAWTAFSPGDRLVLLSKGVIESRDGEHEFGLDRAIELAAQHGQDTPQELCDSILQRALQFAALDAARPMHRLARFGRATLGLRDDEQDLTVLALARD